jgi:arsenate reductase
VIKLYGISNCNKIRNTRKLLELNYIPYEFIDVRKTPLDKQKIEEIGHRVGLKALFNTKGSTYRRLKLDYNKMQDAERLNWLTREQAMIRRPLIENDGHYLVRYDEVSILEFAGSAEQK